MADILNPTTPSVQPEYDWESAKAAIPREQTLWFCSNLAEGSWLPSQYTGDESQHLTPVGWARILFDGRKFQHAWIVQGQSEEQHFNLNILRANGSIGDFSQYFGDGDTASNKLISFVGTDSQGNFIRSDKGFDGTQASVGVIGWSPEAVIAQSSGHFKSARFVLEEPDRHKEIPLLEFDLEIIANQEVFPTAPVYRFYISEFERTLYSIERLINAGQDQLAYMNTIYAAIIKQKLQDLNDQMDAAKKQIDDMTDYGKTQIDSMVKDANNQLNEVKAEIKAQEEAIKSDNLVTFDNMLAIVQGYFDNGKLTISDADDSDLEAKLLCMQNEMEGTN